MFFLFQAFSRPFYLQRLLIYLFKNDKSELNITCLGLAYKYVK